MTTTTTNQTETRTSTGRDKAPAAVKADGRAEAAAAAVDEAASNIKTVVEAATNGFWQRAMAFNGEAARLASVRAGHYREYFDELASCQSPVDAGEVATRAAQTAFQDYMDEFGRLSQIAMSGLPDAGKGGASKR
jgi:hypothetical protein